MIEYVEVPGVGKVPIIGTVDSETGKVTFFKKYAEKKANDRGRNKKIHFRDDRQGVVCENRSVDECGGKNYQRKLF